MFVNAKNMFLEEKKNPSSSLQMVCQGTQTSQGTSLNFVEGE